MTTLHVQWDKQNSISVWLRQDRKCNLINCVIKVDLTVSECKTKGLYDNLWSVWMRACSRKRAAAVNVLGQAVHAKGFSPVWVLRWSSRSTCHRHHSTYIIIRKKILGTICVHPIVNSACNHRFCNCWVILLTLGIVWIIKVIYPNVKDYIMIFRPS